MTQVNTLHTYYKSSCHTASACQININNKQNLVLYCRLSAYQLVSKYKHRKCQSHRYSWIHVILILARFFVHLLNNNYHNFKLFNKYQYNYSTITRCRAYITIVFSSPLCIVWIKYTRHLKYVTRGVSCKQFIIRLKYI